MKTLIYCIFYLSVIAAVGYLAYSNLNGDTWLSNLFKSQNQGKTTQEMLVDITHSINTQFKALEQKNVDQSETIALLEQQMNEIKAQMKDMSHLAKEKKSQETPAISQQKAAVVPSKSSQSSIDNKQNPQQEDMQAIALRKASLREIADKMNMKALNSLTHN